MATATVPSVVDASVPSAPVLPPGSKVICGFCLTEESALWMSVDLFLQPSQCSVYNRLSDMGHSLQQHCLLCAHCYTLVERWDEYMALAKKTQQLLEKRARYPKDATGGQPAAAPAASAATTAPSVSAEAAPLSPPILFDDGSPLWSTSLFAGLPPARRRRGRKPKNLDGPATVRTGPRMTPAGRPTPYVCQKCDMSFVRYSAWLRHKAIHYGIKLRVCPICHAKLRDANSLAVHRHEVHGFGLFTCTYCPKMFHKEELRLRHERVHTGEKPYKCPRCGAGFGQPASVYLHLRKVHGEEPEMGRHAIRQMLAADDGDPAVVQLGDRSEGEEAGSQTSAERQLNDKFTIEITYGDE